MTEANQATAVPNSANAPAKGNPVLDARAKLEKSGKLFFTTASDMTLLAALLDTDNADAIKSYKDWTQKAPKEGFDNASLVETSDDAGETRFIAIASKQTALSDPAVQDYLYDRYVARVMNVARDPESYEAMFATASGMLGGSGIDNIAYRFQAKDWVEVLHQIGMKNAQVRNLETAIQNAAFARATFSRFKPEQWAKLIQQMAANAAKNGHSTAWFDHALANRDLESDTGEEIALPENILEQLANVKQAKDEKAAKSATPANAS